MNIIDVTLRDGGHEVKFDWPMKMAQEYYSVISSIPDVKYVELGYWKQTEKSTNTFYNLDFDKICEITGKRSLKNVSIMIDYHYCSHDISDYPTTDQSEISMIRMCSRKEDIPEALIFGDKLKKATGLNVSFNIFNASNYTKNELMNVCELVSSYPFDYVYFADTHGSMDLDYDFDKFIYPIKILKGSGKGVGMHLHEHSGKAVSNYKTLIKKGMDSTDTSVRGMGKGSGNLKLEHIVNKDSLVHLAEFIRNHDKLLTIKQTPYELITAKYSLTDNYAKQAKNLNMTIQDFDKFCVGVSGLEKDSYNKKLLISYNG